MSYKRKKLRKSKLNVLKYFLRKIRFALYKAKALLQPKMRLPQTIRIMEFLRRQNKGIRPNNKKIDEWVDGYINECILNARPVDILTQWCVAKDLEIRYQVQGNRFVPLKAERDLILKTIPMIIRVFEQNGATVSWWITMNRSYLNSGRIEIPGIEAEYFSMIRELIAESPYSSSLILLDWEDEILKDRPRASQEVEINIFKYVSKGAFEIDLKRHMAWARDDAGLTQSDADLEKDLKFKIGCEAEEGRFLLSLESLFPGGQFLLAPLEQAERYIFFSILTPDFQKRLVSVLKPNIWRLNQEQE